MPAPAGTAEVPSLLNGYLVRPPWEVAGVDYAVGVPAGTVLLTPTATDLPAGVSLDSAHHLVVVTGNNVTLSGYNFSGWSVSITGGASNVTIENSYFPGGANIVADFSTSNISVLDNTFDASAIAANGGSWPAFVVLNNTGTHTVQYNWMANSPSQFLDVGGYGTVNYSYNLLENGANTAGAHLNMIEFGGGTAPGDGVWTNPVISYNTIYQGPSVAGGELIQINGEFSSGVTVNNALVANNTLIAGPGASVSFMIHTDNYVGPGYSTTTGAVNNNYTANDGGASGFIYPIEFGNQGKVSFSGNIDMNTGEVINSNNTETPSTTAPTASSLSATSNSAAFYSGLGDVVTIKMAAKETVFVTGAPTLQLNDNEVAKYAGGSDTNTLTFVYTVQQNDVTSDLSVTGLNLVTLAPGLGPIGASASIKDAAGNALSGPVQADLQMEVIGVIPSHFV